MRKFASALTITLTLALALATPAAWATDPADTGAAADTGMPDPAQVAAALDAHPGVLAAQARVLSAEAEARALARGPYEVTASGSYISRSVDREGRFDEFDGQLLRSVRLPGKARLDREIGSYGVSAARNGSEDVRHQAARLLNDSWWNWLGAAEQARVDRQAVANLTRLLDAVKQRVAVRDAAALEGDRAEAMLGSAQLAAEQSAGAEALARTRLLTVFPQIHAAGDAPAVPRPVLPEAGIDALGQLVVARSHEIAGAEALAGQAAAAASRARADRIADPAFGVRMFSERGGAERGAGVLFSLPLGGGHRKALADRAEAEAGAVASELAATRAEVAAMSQTDMVDARFAFAAWRRAREGLDAEVAALGKLRLGYSAGEIDLADLLLGERQVHEGFRAEAAARAEAMRAITRLRIDSHTLWAPDEGE